MDGRRYLIDAAAPFRGWAEASMNPDGTVAYTDGLTLAAYEAEHGRKYKVIDADTFDALSATYHASLVTEPEPITAERWDDALTVLPPCRWRHVRGIELFHVSERIIADLVDWYARVGPLCFHFVDEARRDPDELAYKVYCVTQA